MTQAGHASPRRTTTSQCKKHENLSYMLWADWATQLLACVRDRSIASPDTNDRVIYCSRSGTGQKRCRATSNTLKVETLLTLSDNRRLRTGPTAAKVVGGIRGSGLKLCDQLQRHRNRFPCPGLWKQGWGRVYDADS